jgi:pimeloyl-ACP methyl ester carboxylesterase
MPYVSNSGVPIYYEVEGTGPPLVLQHGSFCSLEDWREFGYVDALRNGHTLVLIDARGHGKSGKPHDPDAYTLSRRVSDVVAALDDLNIQTADFAGYSMGGWIGFGLGKYAPHRFRSLIFGGAHPFHENMQAFRAMLPKEPSAFQAMLEPAFGPYLTPSVARRIAENDLEALAALTTDRDDLSEVLPTMQMPSLLYVGTQDPRLAQVEECARRMPNVRFFSLPECDHVAGFARSDLVLPKVIEFLDQLK